MILLHGWYWPNLCEVEGSEHIELPAMLMDGVCCRAWGLDC